MPLNPILATMISQMAEAKAPALHEMSPTDGRTMYRAMNAESTREPVTQVSDEDADGIPVRIYNPKPNQILPALLYLHGGGWVIGDLETHDHVCRKLANAANCAVVAVDYRLAPEYPYPAPMEDCYTALKWVADQAGRLGINPQKIAVGGDSAGGNLSAVLALRSRDENGPAICHQLLIYPVTDASFDTPSYKENAEGYMLSKAGMEWFWQHYLGIENDPLLAYVSPLRAADLSNLPPATVFTAEFDPLRDEGEAYAAKLKSAGNKVMFKRYEGVVHGFFAMADILEEAQDAFALSARELSASFAAVDAVDAASTKQLF
jgi:acetyl esterase